MKEPTDYPIHMRKPEPDLDTGPAHMLAFSLFGLIGMIVGFILALLII
jgi:hypothetical protein